MGTHPAPFRDRPLQERLTTFRKLQEQQPDRIPVIIEYQKPFVNGERFLVPPDLNGAQFIYMLRRRLRIDPTETVFLFCGGCLIDTNATIRSLYERHRDLEDSFLYVYYAFENAFGTPAMRNE